MKTIRTVWAATALGVLLSSCAPAPRTDGPRQDRGGIAGDAISLESVDPSVKEYLVRVREKIRSTWVFPCVTDPATQACVYKSAQISLEFGILKNGVLQYVELQKKAGDGLEIYDRHAVEAIQRASPFPVMPPEVVATLKQGSTGMPVVARFNYVVDPSRPSIIAQPGDRPRAGVITALEGTVTARRAGVPAPTPLKVNDTVFLQDTITTGDRARITMVLGGKVDVILRERSSVTIIEAPGRATLDLHTGQLAMTIPKNRIRPGEEIQVRTPNAAAAVHDGIRLSVATSSPRRASGAVVTELDVEDGSTDVVTFPGTSAGQPRAPGPAIRLRAKQGVTITGDVTGPLRPVRKTPTR